MAAAAANSGESSSTGVLVSGAVLLGAALCEAVFCDAVLAVFAAFAVDFAAVLTVVLAVFAVFVGLVALVDLATGCRADFAALPAAVRALFAVPLDVFLVVFSVVRPVVLVDCPELLAERVLISFFIAGNSARGRSFLSKLFSYFNILHQWLRITRAPLQTP
ncbi:MAG: hypothetical protein P8Z80_17020 [Pseudolabrys sp.]